MVVPHLCIPTQSDLATVIFDTKNTVGPCRPIDLFVASKITLTSHSQETTPQILASHRGHIETGSGEKYVVFFVEADPYGNLYFFAQF